MTILRLNSEILQVPTPTLKKITYFLAYSVLPGARTIECITLGNKFFGTWTDKLFRGIKILK